MKKSTKSGAGGGGKNQKGLTTRLLTLQKRLHQALLLGFKYDDIGGQRWLCSDAEIQGHAIRAMSAFVDEINSSTSPVPAVKKSINDMLVALEGILQSRNEAVLLIALEVIIQLIKLLGSSVHQYSVSEIIDRLSALLSSDQVAIFNSAVNALNLILLKMTKRRLQRHQETWKAIQENNVIGSTVNTFQDYIHGRKSYDFVTMASLLRTILWHWPAARYAVWSNARLMAGLETLSMDLDFFSATKILRLYSALALCGNGAMKLLENADTLLPAVIHFMGSSQPVHVRIEALILFQYLSRSAEGFSKMTDVFCEAISERIVNAMNSWKSHTSRNNSDQGQLVVEACRSALITRWPGKHHIHLWKLGIVQALLDLLSFTSNKSSPSPSDASSDELRNKTRESFYASGPLVIRPFVWDIIGWLATYSPVDFDPNDHADERTLNLLIACACHTAVESIPEWPKISQQTSTCSFELEAAFRAVLFLLYSPCRYIASQAQHLVSKALLSYGRKYLIYLFKFLNTIASGDIFMLRNNKSLAAMNLIGILFHMSIPQYWELFPWKAISILWAFIIKCLNSDVEARRSTIAPHLQDASNDRTCCWDLLEDWEGDNEFLFYSLWILYEFLRTTHGSNRQESTQIRVSLDVENLKSENLVNILEKMSSDKFSPGVRWYAASCLSFFGFYGFSYKLGKNIRKALTDDKLTDLQLILSSGHCQRAHNVILMVRCPSLLPPEVLFPKERKSSHPTPVDPDIDNVCIKFQQDVRLSSHVDNDALVKLLEFLYVGYIQEEVPAKQLKRLSKWCKLQSLSDLLLHRRPKWGTSIPRFDFVAALRPDGHLSDSILEAKSAELFPWSCAICDLSTPHMHVHKIILWSSCDYLRALFQSGMEDSYSDTIEVPIGWKALTKLVNWFYSGKLLGHSIDCSWTNLKIDQQLHVLEAYVELVGLSEFWCLDDIGEECFNRILSCLTCDPLLSLETMRIAANLNQMRIVDAAVNHIAPLYPQLRNQGKLEDMEEELSNKLRARYVQISQEQK